MDSILINLIKSSNKSVEMTNKFYLMKSDKDRVVSILSMMDTFGVIPKAKSKVKNAETSIKIRNETNRMFILCKNVDDFVKVWEMYSKSIAIAPNKSEELALAYGNRSAVLIRLRKYRECIEDIDRALELNCPINLKGKLYCRKLECLQRISSNSKITNNTLDKALNWLDNLKIDDNDEEKIKLKKKFYDVNDKIIDFNIKNFNKTLTKKVLDPPKFEKNPEIPCASNAITLEYNDKFGRQIVTTRHIEPGEILIVEKPFSSMLSSENVYTHCSHCLQQHWAMIPCKNCIYVMYCSKKCKQEAWKSYHDIECSVIGYFLNLDYNNRNFFSLRLAILALREAAGSLKKLKDIAEKAENCSDPLKRGFSDDGVYRSDKYCSVHTLVTNTDKRSVIDLFERASNAAVILFFLYTKTILFGKKFSPALNDLIINEDVTYFGGIIMRFMQIIPSNMHDYSEEYKLDTIGIGCTAMPFCSLINHSCNPNVSRCSTKDYMIIYAILPIEKGAQVFDNYGAHFALKNKNERNEKLKQFHFECECRACKQDWPIYQEVPSFYNLLKSSDEKRIIEKALVKFPDYVQYASDDNIDDKPKLLMDLIKMLKTLLRYVPLPCYEVNNVIELLKRVFALTYGNKFEFPRID